MLRRDGVVPVQDHVVAFHPENRPARHVEEQLQTRSELIEHLDRPWMPIAPVG
jgi:hypothetical protein